MNRFSQPLLFRYYLTFFILFFFSVDVCTYVYSELEKFFVSHRFLGKVSSFSRNTRTGTIKSSQVGHHSRSKESHKDKVPVDTQVVNKLSKVREPTCPGEPGGYQGRSQFFFLATQVGIPQPCSMGRWFCFYKACWYRYRFFFSQ